MHISRTAFASYMAPAKRGHRLLWRPWREEGVLALKKNCNVCSTSENATTYGERRRLDCYFRGQFSPAEYVGVELEINQHHVLQAGAPWTVLRKAVIESLRLVLADMQTRPTASGTASCIVPATSRSRTAG